MIKNISKGRNYKAIDIGSFDELSQHSFVHPKFGTEDKGRLFIGKHIQSTGAEISFRELPAQTTIPFLHRHHEHEEIYIFIKGMGKFQVDDDVFEIQEGSIVRVAPNGQRVLSNSSDEVMLYMVIQSLNNGLKAYNVLDGYRTEGEIKL